MFEIEENTLDELPYSITCLQFACLAYEAAPENVNSMRHLECSMDDSYEALKAYIAEQGLRICGHAYEHELLSYFAVPDPSEYVIQISIQVEPAAHGHR